MATNKDGKYTKLTPDTIKRLEEALSVGADITSACFYANIRTQTYYNWKEKNPKMGERFDALRENPVLKAYRTVFKNLDGIETAKWYLERKRKDEFSIKVLTENENINTVDNDELTSKINELIENVKSSATKPNGDTANGN